MRFVQSVLGGFTLLASLASFATNFIQLLLIRNPRCPHQIGLSPDAIRKTKLYGAFGDCIVLVHNHSKTQVQKLHLFIIITKQQLVLLLLVLSR